MMKRYTIFNDGGKILRTGVCSNATFLIVLPVGEFIIEGIANDITQKVVDGQVVNKTPAEIEADRPPKLEPIPLERRQAFITNVQWKDMNNRLEALENK